MLYIDFRKALLSGRLLCPWSLKVLPRWFRPSSAVPAVVGVVGCQDVAGVAQWVHLAVVQASHQCQACQACQACRECPGCQGCHPCPADADARHLSQWNLGVLHQGPIWQWFPQLGRQTPQLIYISNLYQSRQPTIPSPQEVVRLEWNLGGHKVVDGIWWDMMRSKPQSMSLLMSFVHVDSQIVTWNILKSLVWLHFLTFSDFPWLSVLPRRSLHP